LEQRSVGIKGVLVRKEFLDGVLIQGIRKFSSIEDGEEEHEDLRQEMCRGRQLNCSI